MNKHFDILAPFYTKIIKPQKPEKLLSFLPEQYESILDLGGGSGRIAEYLLEKASRLFLIDVSMPMLKQVKNGDIYIINASADTLPFPNASISAIVLVDSFHHMPNQHRVLQEIMRIKTPGGKIIIEEPDIRSPIIKMLAMTEKMLLMRSKFWNPDTIRDSLVKLGATATIHAENNIAWIIAI